MKVDQEVLAILDKGQMTNDLFVLGPDKLDRKTYERVNRVLELAGGQWSRKAKGHVFKGSAEDALEVVIQTGQITDSKKEFQFFETPSHVVTRILHRAGLGPRSSVLEPSAGHGAIALRAAEMAEEVVCYELNPEASVELAKAAQPNVTIQPPGDFLQAEPNPRFSHVLMNPPFSKAQDAKHILRAFDWLAPRGRLVAVCSAGITFRQDRAYAELRALVEARGEIEELPEGSFQSSGTMVNTVLVILDR